MVTRLSKQGSRRYLQFGATTAMVVALSSLGNAPVATAGASGGLPSGHRGRHYGSLRLTQNLTTMLPSVGSPSGAAGGSGGASGGLPEGHRTRHFGSLRSTPSLVRMLPSVGTSSGGGSSSSSSAGLSRGTLVSNSVEPLKQSAGRNLMVFLVDSSDHITGKTGLTLSITASKDGGAFAAVTPTVTERGNGWYSLALTSAHTDTLGDFALHITGTSADPCDLKLPVEIDRTGITATNNDKTGYALSSAGVQAVWDALTSALTTASSIGKKFADFVLGSDSKVMISTNAQTGVTIPTVTTVTDLTVTSHAEPGSVPGASASLKDKIGWIFAVARNKITQTSAQQTVRNDGDTANLGASTVSDDSTTFTRGKFS